MIVLVVRGDGQPQRLPFSKEMIIIGEGASHSVDLSFSGQGLHQNHLKIIQQKDGYIIVNQANDPFVSLNGFPFHKKKLHPGDEIHLHHIRIIIEEIEGEKVPLLPESPLEPISIPSHRPEPQAEAVQDKFEWNEIDKLLEEEERPDPDAADKNGEAAPAVKEAEKEIPLQMVSQYIFDEEEEEGKGRSSPFPHLAEEPEEMPSFWIRNWKWIPVLVLVVFVGMGSVFFEMYLRANGRRETQEIRAAEAVADVSMALTYAQLHQVMPQEQYWADPEFLKNNLQALLSSTSLPCTHLDAQGHLKHCSYFLRIYISNDLSRFLLIAQPSPGLSQWVIPRDAIVTDSNSMELRKINDLKRINRLLANNNPLDGQHDEEIADILSRGEVISLFQIAERVKNGGFAPPKALAYLRPGAENFIYNSPRYHLIGHDILNQAITLNQLGEEGDLKDFVFGTDMALLSKFPNLVLYSSKGMLAALEAQRALTKLAPQEKKFLTAYLKVDSQGNVKSSHLIMDGAWEVADEAPEYHPESFAHVMRESTAEPHPLEEHLSELIAKRKESLMPTSLQIANLIVMDAEGERQDFHKLYNELSHSYGKIREEHYQNIVKALKNLREIYHELSDDDYLEYLRKANLEIIWKRLSHPLNIQDAHRFLLFLTNFTYSFSKELRGISYSLESKA